MEVLSQAVSGPLLYAVSAVIAVLIGAVTVFVFGFKSAEQPAFEKLSSSSADDRKQAGKKRKIKEKKSAANGHATGVTENATKQKSTDVKTTPTKKAQQKEKAAPPPAKEAPLAPAKQLKEKKQETESPTKENLKKVDKKLKSKGKENKEVVVVKNKKNLKQKQPEEKPLDFDDGKWEIVPAKGDKKNRKVQDDITKDQKKESPKKSKKPKKFESDVADDTAVHPVIDNKSVDEVTKEIKDMVNEQQKAAAEVEKKAEIVLTPTVEAEVAKAEPSQNNDAKKKKSKKIASQNEEAEKAVGPVPSAPAPKKEKKKAENIAEAPKSTEIVVETSVAFDELGDVWTEAKAPKKSKKKARKE